MLSFQLMGSVFLLKDGQPISQFRSQKEVALLIYLAQTGQPHSRDFLADLLWDGRTTQQSLSNLRTVLVRLGKQVDDELVVSRKTLSLASERYQVDSVRLLRTLADVGPINSASQAHLVQSALNAYRGDFLADFSLPDAPQFEQWMMTTREHLRHQVSAAFARVGEYVFEHGTIEEGLAIAHRWLAVDALDDAPHMLMMRLLLKDGQASAAVAHYDEYARLMREELELLPSVEMTTLIKKVLISHEREKLVVQLPSALLSAITNHHAHSPRHNLPAPHDQFFGRVAVQQDIVKRLDQQWCRLVTLVGQGGVGKTRLATTVARNRLQQYADGVWLVELAEVDRDDGDLAEALAVEIATALDLRLSGATKPVEQVLNHLQHKEMLLVLDNFEHLLDGGVQIVLDILQRCEKVQILVTSREALNVRAEWTIALSGLAFPANDLDETPVDAMELFVARCAQWRQDELGPEEFVIARQICRLMEGLPLAIELVAALSHGTKLRKIADELLQGFDALTTSLRDMPPRHRSLQIVFEMSWRVLPDALQLCLAHLSIFRGGFTLTAASSIANANALQLAELKKKSLLTHDVSAERYALHPVVRAYAAAKLIDLDAVAQKHAEYYLALLAQQSDVLQLDAPQQGVAALEAELENVRLAWQNGLADKRIDLLTAALTPLSIVYQLRGLTHEAEATMNTTLQSARAWGGDGLGLATHVGLERGRFQNRLGRYRAAIESVEVALRFAQRIEDEWAVGMGHVLWGEALWRLGEYDAAVQKLQSALGIAQASDSTFLQGWAHHHLGIIDDILGHYAAAHGHLQQACDAWRELNNAQILSNSLNSIGLIRYHQGDFAAAQQAMDQALFICTQLDNRHLQSILLNNLSMVATEQGDYLSAHHYLQRGLELAITSGNLASQGEIYSNLGKNYSLLGETALAIQALEQGLQMAELLGNRPLMAVTMIHLAETKRNQDEVKRAEFWYTEALQIARQDSLQHIQGEALISLSELLSKEDVSEARQYCDGALMLAEVLQNPLMLKRANDIHHYLSSSR